MRSRLTLVYGALFAATGAVLLAITYLLVLTSRPPTPLVAGEGPTGDLRALARHQHQAMLENLLLKSVMALALMAVISFVVGWLVAGRMLRPLRTMNSAIKRISARNVHERLALPGPRDELRNLADTVDGLLERLHSAFDARKRFVANAAHELRTPLTLEHALLEESLLDEDRDVSSMRSTMARLLDLSEQQGRLLESLLTLAESEGGLDHRDPLDLAEIAERVVRTAEEAGPRVDGDNPGAGEGNGSRADGNSHCTDAAPGPGGHGRPPAAGRPSPRLVAAIAHAPTAGDPALVERLIANLVDNAVRYNVPGGRVDISTRAEGDRAVVSIANTGPAIPPEQVYRLFEPFQRLDRTRVDDHHGLGLSIVRAIAVAHDARLTADARPQGGLAIEIHFPLAGLR
ncbi:cell wall metabolism sensor histidine kinase WalK [Nonomuraea sp. WAC 01424]|uniref:sensor histidine kinase n=1 Tax=Nonomuraea sp. WAC 01424 TaxID=2203200 RepID=UPI001C8CC7D8|nr:ATP-binding protein [Nonomuraea sp. WAC 01424]